MSDGWTCQPYGRALSKAGELAGVRSFTSLGRDAEIEAKIAAGVEVYRQSAVESIPALLLPGGVLRGHVSSADELFAILRKILAAR